MITAIIVIVILALLWVITHLYEELNLANQYKEELRSSINSLEELLMLHNKKNVLSSWAYHWIVGPYETTQTAALEIEGKKRTIDFAYGKNITEQVEKIKEDIALEKNVSAIASDIANKEIKKREAEKARIEHIANTYDQVIRGLDFSSISIDDYVPSKKKTTKKATTKKKAS